MSKPAVTPADARELLQFVELTAIQVFEISGRLADPDSDGLEDTGEVSPELGVRVSGDALTVRMRLELVSKDAVYVADMAVEYTLDRPVNFLGSVASEFVERVAAMAVFPYVRESIFTTATRMGRDAPVLGLMKSGDFSVGEMEGPDFIASTKSVSVAALAKETKLTVEGVLELMAGSDLEAKSARSKVPGPFAAMLRETAHRIAQGTQEV